MSVIIVRKLFVNANDSLLISTAKLSNWLAESLPVLNFTHAKRTTQECLIIIAAALLAKGYVIVATSIAG